jgi:hypothetical protein
MFLESAIGTIATLLAAGFAAMKGEDLLIRLGWLRSPLEDEMVTSDRPPPRRLPPRPELIVPQMAYDPIAFWLWPDWSGKDHPADRGFVPFWMREPKEPVAAIEAQEPCSQCGSTNISFGPDNALCRDCGNYRHFRNDVPTQGSSASRPKLPCGCPHYTDVVSMRAPWTGFRVVRCESCKAEWEPASNSADGKRLGQGEEVHFPKYKPHMPPQRAKNYQHGACPTCSEPCTVFEHTGRAYYTCTSKKCDKHFEGWGSHGKRLVRAKMGWREPRTPEQIKAMRND